MRAECTYSGLVGDCNWTGDTSELKDEYYSELTDDEINGWIGLAGACPECGSPAIGYPDKEKI